MEPYKDGMFSASACTWHCPGMLCQSCADEDVPEDFVSLVKQTPLGRYGADAPMRPGTATITQIPKLVECSPIAALIPQTKVSGEDSYVPPAYACASVPYLPIGYLLYWHGRRRLCSAVG